MNIEWCKSKVQKQTHFFAKDSPTRSSGHLQKQTHLFADDSPMRPAANLRKTNPLDDPWNFGNF
jgi:hypothetical protein